MVNGQLLKGKIYERGFTLEKIAEIIELNRGTLSTKLNNRCDFTIKQADRIVKALSLTEDETMKIFLINLSHKCNKSKADKAMYNKMLTSAK